MNDYDRIASVIRYLDEHYAEQPDLGTLSSLLGLSPSHFHRLFSQWAGITPKDFLQCLTLEHAKKLLSNGRSVLHAALSTGLSGPGRLHDLCLNLEAASPGELKSGGAGLTVRYGVSATPFGQWLVAETERGICHISFLDGEIADHDLARLRTQWPNATLKQNDAAATQLAQRVFSRSPAAPAKHNLRVTVQASPFRLRVWRALLQVPAGALVSYGDLASAIGQPQASRAVGSAVANNPIAFLIPCHRVIRETGIIGNYRWNPIRKKSMLAWESAPSPVQTN